MAKEYYMFFNVPAKRKWLSRKSDSPISVASIIDALSDAVLREILDPPYVVNKISLYVDALNKDAIKTIGNVLSEKKIRYEKTRHIEAEQDEIENYDYYYVDVKCMEWGKHIFYEVTPPQCDYEPCAWGAKIISPVNAHMEYLHGVNIRKCVDIWGMGIRFIISKTLKELFESEDVTGLRYESCEVDRNGSDSVSQSSFYVAEVIPAVKQEGTQIELRTFCKKHRVVISGNIFGIVTRRMSIGNYDFQMIDGVRIKKKDYFYRLPLFFVSKKVMKILKVNCSSDLPPQGIFYKSALIPVPFD
jgi:hypothetical protein